MDPVTYLQSSYYERWLTALETLIAENGLPQAVGAVAPQEAMEDAAAAPTTDADPAPLFKVGDPVNARVIHFQRTHAPAKICARTAGVVERDWGVFAYPEQPEPKEESYR